MNAVRFQNQVAFNDGTLKIFASINDAKFGCRGQIDKACRTQDEFRAHRQAMRMAVEQADGSIRHEQIKKWTPTNIPPIRANTQLYWTRSSVVRPNLRKDLQEEASRILASRRKITWLTAA